MSADAHHLTAPPEDGNGVARVMRAALEDAGLTPISVQYLNAHATSTPLGDIAEAGPSSGLRRRTAGLAVSSTKSMTGHLLGGAGALEAGLTVMALRTDRAAHHQSRSTRTPRSRSTWCRIAPGRSRCSHAMTNSFGFGGTNASLIFARP